MAQYNSATPDEDVGAQALQNARAAPADELPQAVTPRSAAVRNLAGTAMGPEQMAQAAVTQAMTPDKLTEVAPGASLYNSRLGKVTFTAPAKPAEPAKRTVEWKDTGKQLEPVYSDTGENVPGLKPKPKSLTPLQSQGSDFSDKAKELAYQTYITSGKLPISVRSASAQSAMLNYISKRAEEDGNTAQAMTARAQGTKAAGETLKSFTSGKNGNTVRSLNVAIQHLDQLAQLGSALQNGDTPMLNRLGNLWAKGTGQAAPVTFDAMKKVVADELVKAVVGSGGGVADREEAAHSMDATQSPEQMAQVISNYKGLMGGQLNGLRKQYEEGTGLADFERFLLPITKAELEPPETAATAKAPPATNAKGWVLHKDAKGNQAYVSPDGKSYEELK
jgi:hypothetical protein